MASAKKPTKTRASQYEAILESYKTTLSECIVMSFKFKDESTSYSYHFKVLESHNNPLIYDGPSNVVRMVIKKENTELFERLTTLAQSLNGEYKECRNYNDYE